MPYTVFMDPQLGRVGLSERDAAEQGKTFKVAKLPMSSVARAIEKSQTRGFMKALVDSETNQILGRGDFGARGRRSDERFASSDAGRAALHRAARFSFCPPDAERIAQQPVYDACSCLVTLAVDHFSRTVSVVRVLEF